MTTPDSAMQADPFDAALAHVLTLPKAEQARLAEVMAVLVRAEVIGNQAQENQTADQILAPSLAEWLDEIEANDPWTRLQLIDDASTKIDPDEEGGELEAARRAILSAHPPLAVRYAVSQLVDQHPWACLFGWIGLCLGLITTGRGLFRLVF